MLESLIDELDDVVVVERIPGLFALLAELDEAGRTQDAELVRDGRLTHLQGLGDVADAHLLFGCEQRQELDARPVAENLKKLREPQARLIVEAVQERILDFIGMGVMDFAEIFVLVHVLPNSFLVYYLYYISLFQELE